MFNEQNPNGNWMPVLYSLYLYPLASSLNQKKPIFRAKLRWGPDTILYKLQGTSTSSNSILVPVAECPFSSIVSYVTFWSTSPSLIVGQKKNVRCSGEFWLEYMIIFGIKLPYFLMLIIKCSLISQTLAKLSTELYHLGQHPFTSE